MKQNTLKLLSCSLILLVALSCKKKKGVLDDFDSGRFDFVCIWEKNGIHDTLIGEASGPYIQGNYYFRVRQELDSENSFFQLIGPSDNSSLSLFYADGISLNAPIIDSEHDSDHLLVKFQSSTLVGSLNLIRK